jgi:hypothetical protein
VLDDVKSCENAWENQLLPTGPNPSCQPFVVSKDQVVYPDDKASFQCSASHPIPSDSITFLDLQWKYDAETYSDISLIDRYPRRSGITVDNFSNDDTNDLASFEIPSPQVCSQTGLYWEATVPVSHVNRWKVNNLMSSSF